MERLGADTDGLRPTLVDGVGEGRGTLFSMVEGAVRIVCCVDGNDRVLGA